MAPARFNPFPGLRPFEPDEDHLFFGREKESDELLRRLRLTRFLTVVGASGSGKSSLVRSGLIPSLQSGMMAGTGSGWRIAILRPGEDPIGNLAAALDAPDVLGTEGELGTTNRVVLEATLRRSTLGLVGAVQQSGAAAADNLLVVVDQFEELFRFRRSRSVANSRDEAVAFVKTLLEAARQTDVAIYVVLTMRSDFIGDCMEFPGLAEAVSAGQYLVPRMSRDEVRAAITGPVAVGGGTIAPRLVLRVLNDLGDDPDQLPVLQHALMRTWDHWERRQTDQPIDISDYDAVGTMTEALSLHAEEAFADCDPEGREVAEHLFKALTDTVSDPRGVRRPTSVADLAAICGASEADVIRNVEIFRRPGRSFLMPPGVPLTSRSIVDISHESLMRCWRRLIAWAEEERGATAFYLRLSQAATWFDEGTAGLWRNPELELGLRWKRENHPTQAWAARYNASFDRAMDFLARSEQERARLDAEREREQKRKLRQARWAAGILGTLLAVAVATAYVAWRENTRAEANLQLARAAVDETLSSVEVDPARMGADVPQMEEFRRELLERTKRFYVEFIKQQPHSEGLYRENAAARFRLGHINRMLGRGDDAVREYTDAATQFGALSRDHPDKPEYKSLQALAYNWLGESWRPTTGHAADAERAYNSALGIQQGLLATDTVSADYQHQLARTHYNRGILRSTQSARPEDEAFHAAEADFRAAIRLLEGASSGAPQPAVRQELARAYNNLAALVAVDEARMQEASGLYERAIALDEAVLRDEPANRQVKFELAQFYDNLANLLQDLDRVDQAALRSERALVLLDDLARPAPSLGVELADTHNLRGRILEIQDPASAAREYEEALRLFDQLGRSGASHQTADYHERFGDLLLNLATLTHAAPGNADARRLLVRAVEGYVALANRGLAAGSTLDADVVLENISRLVPQLSESERAVVEPLASALRDRRAHPTISDLSRKP